MTALLLFLPLTLFNLFQDGDFKSDIRIPRTNTNMEIATDAGFANQTLQFSAGQTIYVRVTVESSGDSKSVLNLHDNLYKLLVTYQLARSGSGPYQFTANFSAPGSAGNYSLEANIESNGSVTNYVRSIEVKGESSDQSKDSEVNVKIENKVNTGDQVLSEKDVPTPSPSPSDQPSPTPTSEPASQGFFASLWSKIANFFSGLF